MYNIEKVKKINFPYPDPILIRVVQAKQLISYTLTDPIRSQRNSGF